MIYRSIDRLIGGGGGGGGGAAVPQCRRSSNAKRGEELHCGMQKQMIVCTSTSVLMITLYYLSVNERGVVPEAISPWRRGFGRWREQVVSLDLHNHRHPKGRGINIEYSLKPRGVEKDNTSFDYFVGTLG